MYSKYFKPIYIIELKTFNTFVLTDENELYYEIMDCNEKHYKIKKSQFNKWFKFQ